MGVRVIGVQFVGDDSQLDRTIASATGKIEAFKRRAEAAGVAVERSSRRQTKATTDAAKAQEQVGAAAAKAGAKQEQSADKAAKAVERAARREEAAEKAKQRQIEQTRKVRAAAAEKVGTGLVLGGLVAGAGVGLAIREFAEFDRAMSRAAAGTDATTSQLERLRGAAIKAGADTQYSATEAADAITALGKAGVSVNDILGGGLQGSLSLAAAGELDVGQAAEIAATAMTQFNLQGKDLGHVADLLAAGAGKAQGDVTDLANALKYVGPVAASMGVSIEQTTGVLAEFAAKGIIGEQAGTSLRGLLTSLTSPSKIAAGEMKNLGLQLYDARGNFSGLASVAGQLHDSLGGLTQAERDEALGRIFGNEQITAARVLYAGGAEAVEAWTRKVNDSGFAARQAARLTDNLSGDLERFRGSLDTAFIQGGSGTNDGLRGLVKDATAVVNAFGALPAGVQQATVTLTGLGAVAAIVGGGFLVLVPKVQAAKLAFIELTGSATAARTALLTVSRAFAVVGVAAVATEVGAFIGDAQQAKVSSDKLAASLASLGSSGKLDKTGLAFFSEGLGPFRRDADDTSEALRRFGDAAYNALDSGWDARLGRLQDFGADQKRFTSQVGQVDAALAGLVTSGHGDQAAASLAKFLQAAADAGAPVDKVRAQFKAYDEALAASADASDGTAQAADRLGLAFSKNELAAKALADQIKEAAAEAGDAAGEAFSGAADVLGNFSKGDNLGKSFDAAIAQAQTFSKNIDAAIKRGLDPDAVEELLKAGPEKAGPVLEALIKDQSGRLIRLTNKGRTELARLQQGVVEQARLTAIAVASGSDKLSGELADATQIARAKGKLGARATAEEIAKALKLPSGRVKGIAADFGITLLTGTQAALNAKKLQVTAEAKITGNIQDLQTQLARAKQALGTLPKEKQAEVRGEIRDLERKIARARRLLASVRDKNVTLTIEQRLTGAKTDAAYNAGIFSGINKKATGGLVTGPGTGTSDSIPVLVSNREYVHTAAAVDYYGVGFMEKLNRMQLPRFAAGGQVGVRPVAVTGGGAAAPVLVRIPVNEDHSRPVNFHGPVTVQAENPDEYVDWARTTEAYT